MPVEPSFSDRVRIVCAPVTEELGFAGREGQVFGESIPSRSGVGPIIGEKGEDYAYSVFFEDADEQHWFAPHLVEFVDYATGSDESDPILDAILKSRERLPFAVPDPTGELSRRLEPDRDEPK